MRSFIYHLKDTQGNLVDYKTTAKKATELVEGHGTRLTWLEKNGFVPIKHAVVFSQPTNTVPQMQTNTQEVVSQNQDKFCTTCGKKMEFREGVSKTGKQYKGYFCSENGHPPEWVK